MEDSEAFSRSLTEAGFERFDSVGAFHRFRHRLNLLLVVDLMLTENPTFTMLWSPAKDFEIDGKSIKVPAFEHLIALKLHAAKNEGRSKRDLEDISALLKLNPSALSPAVLLDLCHRYGPEESTLHLRSFL